MRIEFNKTGFIVGKSAEDNWKIISKADKDYYWLHANNIPSSHIIIETDVPVKDEIEYACQLCRNQSKKIKNTSSFVMTQIKNLKFGSKPGEVIIKNQADISLIV